MTLIQPIAFDVGKNKKARVYTLNAFQNPLLCSKYFLAEGLFDRAHLKEKPDVTEVVCASIGNFGLAVAYLAARHQLRATIFLPKNIPKRTVRLMEIFGAEIHHTGYEKLSSEVAPCAIEYANASPSRLHLDQFDLDVCSQIYFFQIFESIASYLPLHGIARPIRLFLPWGTGSLYMAGATLLCTIPPKGTHEVVPISPWSADDAGEQKRAWIASKFSNIQFLSVEKIAWEETLGILRGLSPRVDIPFDLISAETIAGAYRHLSAIDPNLEIDLVPVLTDGFVSSYFGEEETDQTHDQ